MDPGAPFAPQALPSRPLVGLSNGRPLHLVLDPLNDGAETGEEYDALRDLFLSGSPLAPASAVPQTTVPPTVALNGRCDPESTLESPRRTAPQSVAREVLVEGLILGHLPVFGPAWVGQYARSLADEVGGAVGLIGIRAGQTTLDVYGPGATELSECGAFDEAVAVAAPVVARWLVRVDETSEPTMADSARLARITLLTGVDEAAIVACYRALKRLVRQDEDGGPVGPAVRLAVMGSAPERAGPAAEKLSRAAETFLGRRIEASACLSKISPGRSVSMYRGQTGIGLDGVLDLIAAAPKTTRPRTIKAPERVATPKVARASDEPAILEPEVRVESRPETQPVTRPMVSVEARTQQQPEARVESRVHSSPTAGASLCTRIGGLHPLAARCPHAPGVELACDSSGVLHLVAQAEESGGSATVEERALAQLTACGAWAMAHLTLIALTAPEAKLLTAGARPVLHLATRNAPAVRRLLDADVRVHLVATVEVDGKSATVCVALN